MNKKINCPLYGFISITPRMRSIIDTPEFKRLHNLRQLGLTYLIYPSANHTRFEHSLGVSHLAKILATSLQKNQPELQITDNEIIERFVDFKFSTYNLKFGATSVIKTG